MRTLTGEKQADQSKSIANAVAQTRRGDGFAFQLADNRPQAVAQRKLQEMANHFSTRKTLPVHQKEIKQPLPGNFPIQRRQHGDLVIQTFLNQNPQGEEEAQQEYVARVQALFKQEFLQHDKGDIDQLRRLAWKARLPTGKQPAAPAIPLSGTFNDHILGNQIGVGWHSESAHANGAVGYSYQNRGNIATSKGTYFAGTVVIGGTAKAGNAGRTTFYPAGLPIATIRADALYVAHKFPQVGQIRRGRGRQSGIMIDCLINGGVIESAYPYKPGW